MGSVTVLLSIGILVASFLVGMGLFYVIHADTKEIKKQQLETVISYCIQFIIYLWIGKMLATFPKVLHDPLAVLAQPGDSRAFYIATVFTGIHIVYKSRQGKLNTTALLETFVPVFFITSFAYEFLQIMIEKNNIGFYFIWVMLCAVFYIGLYKKNQDVVISYCLFIGWIIGALVMSFIKGYLVLFGFLIQPIYFILLLVLFVLLIWKKREQQTSDS